MAIRRLTMLGRIFTTVFFLLTKSTSIANFIPNVWTLSHGTIHNPSPSASPVCFNSPVRRSLLVPATAIRSPRTVPRVRFRINKSEYHSFNTG